MTRLPDARDTSCLALVELVGVSPTRLSPLLEADREQAVADLEAENHFVLPSHAGPYRLKLSIQEGRMILDVRQLDDTPITAIGLALGPFRRLIKDYQLLVDSFARAVEDGQQARLEAIDMGRRGLHDEGAGLLVQRLEGKVVMDLATARRLFTLVCVLHTRIWE